MVIGRALTCPEDLAELQAAVPNEVFYYRHTRRAWAALRSMVSHRKPITAEAFRDELAQDSEVGEDNARKLFVDIFAPEALAGTPGLVENAVSRLRQCAHQRQRAGLVEKLRQHAEGNGDFTEVLDELNEHEERDPLKPLPWVDKPKRSRAIRSDEFMAMDIPEPEELVYPALVMREAVTLVAGPSKFGKSILVMNLAKSLVTGDEFLTRHPVKRASVLYLQTEMGASAVKKRLGQMALLSDRLWIRNVEPGELKLNTARKGNYGRRTETGHRESILSLVKDLREREVEVLIVDPLYELLDGSEVDEFAMKSLFECLKGIARYTPCAVVAVHHTKKRREGDWQGPELASGHNVLTRAPDALLTTIEHPREDGSRRYQLTYTLRHAAAPRPVELIQDEVAGPLTWRAVPWADEGSLDVLVLLEDGAKTTDELAKEGGVSKRTLQRRLGRLKEAGEVEYHSGAWVLSGGRSVGGF